MWRAIGVLGLIGLAGCFSAYWLTLEPAPRVRILWGRGVTATQQAALERQFGLRNGRDRMPAGSVAYDLMDTRPSNIRALIEHPSVADTNDIERHSYTVPFDVDYGGEWMWIADRTPGLQDRRVRRVLFVILTAMALAGLPRFRHRKHG